MAQHEQWDIVSGVGITALMVAACRDMETQRDDRLISDPYAKPLVQAANAPQAALTTDSVSGELLDDFSGYLGIRSRYFDDWFDRACASGVRQAVILASGLDTRAFRLNWPEGFRIFEIDQPKVLEFKTGVLAEVGATPSSEHHVLPLDLRDDWATALTATPFDPKVPTAWLAEGLLPYLPADAERRLIDTLHELSAPGSHVALESVTRNMTEVIDDQLMERSKDMVGFDVRELFNAEERPDPVDLLAERGWKVRADGVADIAARYDRKLGELTDAVRRHGRMVVAQKA